jgi:Domain of unknown function (DUF4249)
MKRQLYLFFVLNLTFLVSSCVDSVPFPTKSEEGFLSVEGTFHNLADTQFVKLFRSQGYAAPPVFVSDAKVTVFGNDKTSGTFEEIRPGVYALMPDILRGAVGTSYYVEIKTKDGKIYRSEPEVMPEPIKPDSISFSAYDKEELSPSGLKTTEKVLKVEINTPLKHSGLDAFFHWTIEDGFEFKEISYSPLQMPPPRTCYYTRKVMPAERIAIASSKDLKISYADAFRINEMSLEQFNLQFKQIHVWQISQNSITEKAYTYWKEINEISFQVGSLFDVTPAYVKGNIYNVNDKDEKVLGYFEVAATERIARPLSIGEINRDFISILLKEEYPCNDDVKRQCGNGYFFNDRIEQICCDCPSYQISGWFNSLKKPTYWK